MAYAMDDAGYYPYGDVRRTAANTFAANPMAWIGPVSNISVPYSVTAPFKIDWRLRMYYPEDQKQAPSAVFVGHDSRRFDDRIVAALIREWQKMGPIGLSNSVVDRGAELIQQAHGQYGPKRRTEAFSNHTLSARVGQYDLVVEFHDVEGFIDDESVVSDSSRAYLRFTFVGHQL